MNTIQEKIKKGIIHETDLTRKLTIDGITKIHKVYKVKLDYLYFNDKNDRIATWINKYKNDNSIKELDKDDKKKYNEIIHGFIFASNPMSMKKTQKNIEMVEQREPGVILSDGRIIDGNRRVFCLRNLAEKNSKFNYFETVILDKKLEDNEKEIKKLELNIQHGEESKIDYNPIDRLVGIHNDIVDNSLLTITEYANSSNIGENEIEKLVQLSNLLVEFLEHINAPKQFYIARDMDLYGPMVELYGVLKKIKDEDKIENMKIAAFTNFLMQPQGDMTRFIRKIKPVATSTYVDEFLEEQLILAEEVMDNLENVRKIDIDVINKEIRKNEEIRSKLTRSLDKADIKVKSSETRERPLKILDKIEDSLTSIDLNIIKKLNKEQILSMKNSMENIDEAIINIKEAIKNIYNENM
ncbi:MAG: hypothetical protein N4A54_07750 [Peptostreptococcaceae bacterium]|jgi:hypothetical protein|nr:hypothetical protein [Peptostreptococcaceae bacterium]